MSLSREQRIEGIKQLKGQGASDEAVQAWLDGLGPATQPTEQPQVTEQPTTPEPAGNGILSRRAVTANDRFFSRFASKAQEAGGKFIERVRGFKGQLEREEISGAGALFRTSGALLGGVGEALAGGVPEPLEKAFGKLAEPVLKDENIQTVIVEWSKLIKDLEINDPPKAELLTATLENTFGILGVLEGGSLLKGGIARQIPKIARETVEEAITKAPTLTRKIGETIEKTVEKIKSPFVPRTKKQILAVPESKVKNLPVHEQKIWFDDKNIKSKGRVSEVVEEGEKIATKESTEVSVRTKKAILDSKVEVGELMEGQIRTSVDIAIKARPKVLASMRRQSNKYRELVDDAMKGNRDTIVDKGDLKNYIDSRFIDDEGRALAIKERLGLTETVDPLSTRAVSVALRKNKTTLGELHEQSKALRQTTGKSPTKVFSPSDKLTDDAIDALLSYMKENGVDLGDANAFWAEYVPIRNQLISELKPFLKADIKAGKFAKTLQNVAEGKGIPDEVFISEVEDLLDVSLTDELRDGMKMITDKEKQQIALKINKGIEKIDIQMKKDLKIENVKGSEKIYLDRLKDVKIAAERSARIRADAKKVFKGAVKATVWAGGAVLGGIGIRSLFR